MSQTRKSMKMTAAMSAIIFVLFLLQMQAVGMGLGQSVLYATVMAAMTAVVGAMSFGYRSMLQRRAMAGKKLPEDSFESHQQRTVEIDLPFDAAMDLALDALKTLDGQRVPVPDDLLVRLENMLPRKQRLRVHKEDREMGTIKTGLRGSVIGIPDPVEFSRIDIQLQRVDEGTTRIRIDSKANTLFDAYDLGKNLHYVKHLASYLRRESLSEAERDQWDDLDFDDEVDANVMKR